MSIIAETLQRLQKRSTRQESETSDPASGPVLPKSKREPGWHTPPSRVRFWLAGVGMAIGLTGFGLAAYWVGFHLDFGLSTYASPSQRLSPLGYSPVPETPTPGLPSSDSTTESDFISIEDSEIRSSHQPDHSSSDSGTVGSIEPLDPPKANNAIIEQNTSENPGSKLPNTPSPSFSDKQTESVPGPAMVEITSKVTDGSDEQASPQSKVPPAGVPETPNFDGSHASLKLADPEEHPVMEKLLNHNNHTGKEKGNVDSVPAYRMSGKKPSIADNVTMTSPKEPLPRNSQSINNDPTSSATLLRHVQQLIGDGKYDETIAALAPLFNEPPVEWEPWFWMGTALLGRDELEQADQFFLSGLARNDKIPQLWVQRALVAQQRGEFQLAIHELRRAEALDADLPHIHLNMGYAYENLGNDRLANEYYAKFLKSSEGNPAFFATRKKLYARLTEPVQPSVSHGLSSSLPDNP